MPSRAVAMGMCQDNHSIGVVPMKPRWSMAAERQTRPDDGVDIALMRRLAAGDQQALADLYQRHGGVLLGVGVRIVGGRAEAEDVLHDVFVEVWKRAADFDATRGSVRTWLAMRMRSRCLDRQKSPRVARRVAFVDSAAARTAAPEQNPLLRLERQRVREALQTLPEEQRIVIDLAYFKGLSTQEIGERVGVPQGTVKSRLFAAREKLARALAGVAGQTATGGHDADG
jgi:RNA polymerase sigma-70 factor (ECF subfamily)